MNKETLKNSFQRFQEEGIVQVVKSKDAKVPPRLRLAPEWTPSRELETGDLIASGRLWDFTEKIAKSRREGKNRRDGATVSTRVLRLTDMLGRKLFEEATTPKLSHEEVLDLKRTVREERRRKSLDRRAHL